MSSSAPRGGPGRSAWEAGSLIGRYMLLTPLAQGGMAEIWLARQSGLSGFEKLVAIKRMTGALEAESEYVEMFLTEARLAAQLNHPNVVQIYELGEQAGSLYIVMEYLDGENLSVTRRTGQKHGLPPPDALSARYIAWAADGLHYAHTRTGLDGKPLHIVHRDVSPHNLIATMDGGLKVVDFGIAKLASQHTTSGKLKGKFAYMAPEQARGEQVDARSDVFALGICLFELVTRTRLFPNLEDVQILSALSGADRLPRPTERRDDVPKGLEAVIRKAMERKREARFQSARELHDALEDWLRTTGVSATSTDASEYLRTVFARRVHERRELIEAAMRADLTPHSAKSFDQLARIHGKEPSGSSGARSIPSLPGPSLGTKLVRAGLVVAVLAAAVGIGVAVAPREEPKAQLVQPAVVEPAPAPAVLVVDTVPSGATLVVDGNPRGMTPLTMDDLPLGAHRVDATLAGHQPAQRTVTLSRPGERVSVEIALLPAPAANTEPDAGAAKPKPRPVVEAAPGKLTLKTDPWTTVYLGKKNLGDTPLLNVPLPAGRHVLRLVNPEKRIESTIEVEIAPNETTVKRLSL